MVDFDINVRPDPELIKKHYELMAIADGHKNAGYHATAREIYQEAYEVMQRAIVGSLVRGAVKTALDEISDCSECYGTGKYKGWGGPCPRGHGSVRKD